MKKLISSLFQHNSVEAPKIMTSHSWYRWRENTQNVYGYPEYFFRDVLRLDFSSAIRCEDVSVQDFSVVPRCWFIDAYFRCEKCRQEFCWTAQEQKHWFEELHFWVKSQPKLCPQCSKDRRTVRRMGDYYGANIQSAVRRSASLELKRTMIDTIDKLEQLSNEPLSTKKRENRNILKKQVAKLLNEPPDDATENGKTWKSTFFKDFLPSSEFPVTLSKAKRFGSNSD